MIKDVFKHGDKYFNSSDILVVDIFGYYFFKDRTGDTFRWRGENVASAEVEGIVMRVAGLSDCVVYGVDVRVLLQTQRLSLIFFILDS